MQHRNVSPEAMDLIFKNAAWGSLGIKLTPDVAKIEEVKKEEPKAPITEAKAPEAVEKHVCPLCESELKEAIPDARLMEHTKNMVKVLTEAEEEIVSEDEETEEDEDETEEGEVDELEVEEDEEEVEEEE